MKFFVLLPLLFLMTACGVQTDIRQQTANHIARPAFMSERTINYKDVTLKVWERMHQSGAPVTIYIEDSSHDITNPTIAEPIGLMLASRDLSSNVAYLGSPCQFIKNPHMKGCDKAYWGKRKFSPAVIEAYETALENIQSLYGVTDIHMVGYGDGANIAAVLTARNDDILSLRTVAGNLNPTLKKGHNLAAESLYAVDYGTDLARVPQIHYIGGVDQLITPKYYHSYRQAVGLSECIQYAFIADADHRRGWVEKWPELLANTPKCDESYKALPPMPPAPTKIPDTGFGKDKKIGK